VGSGIIKFIATTGCNTTVQYQDRGSIMGTSRCWQDNVVNGFHQRKTRASVAERKKVRRLEVRRIIKDLKAAGKPIDLQAINHEVVDKFRRKRQSQKSRHVV